MSEKPTINEAQNRDPSPGPEGEKPYEMEGRKEERSPFIDFQDVTGWLVEGRNAEGRLYRSNEQKIYRDHCAKLVYVGGEGDPSLLVRPGEPIIVPDPWDSLNFWNYGNGWGWSPDPANPFPQVSAVLKDARGREFEMPLGTMNYQYWFLMNGRLHERDLERPVSFVGFRFRNVGSREKRSIYLGPCYFFEEKLEPLEFEPFPEKLPFPTRPETILPMNKAASFENLVSRSGNTAILSYKGADCELEYRCTPMTGTLSDIELSHNGKRMKPCAGGGIRFPAGAPMESTLKESSVTGDAVKSVWQYRLDDEIVEVEYRIRISQKSIIVELCADKPLIDEISLGRAEGIEKGRLIKIPYLTYGGNDPRVLYADGLFFFTQFDWFVSDASVLFGGSELDDDWAVYNGGARYIPKTNGERNKVRERLFINVSPDFHEVLPTIPNPKSPMKEEQGDRLWRVKFGGQSDAEIAEARQLRNYGCEKISIRYHEDTWRDTGESFTFRLDPAPKRGGDRFLKEFVKAVKEVGWRVGLYTNYTDYAPVNKYWNEDWVNRLPNGDWQRAWMRCYAPKPMIAVQMEAELAPRIQEKFGENHSYCDVHTAVSPFSRVDYDHRVPGAGTFRKTFECFGRLLYNEKFAHRGPVYSEGNNHWWYVGLTDGNYAQIVSADPPGEPLLVDFDLLKMHPLNMDAGMGAPEMFFRKTPHDLDQFIATTIAYGHIGFFSWNDLDGMLKIYYMIQQIQKRYTLEPVKQIEYECGGNLVGTSEALAYGDAPCTERLHVVYENGTEIWVNTSDAVWSVETSAGRYDLPRWGYAALSDDGLLAYSAVDPGSRRRVDCCMGTDQFYADSRGGYISFGKLAVEGSGVLKRDYGKWWFIPTTKCTEFAFDPALIGMSESNDIEVIGYSDQGAAVGSPATFRKDGLFHIKPGTDSAFKYEIR